MSDHRHYLQFPTCKNNQLAFVSEDDLWLCDLTTMHTRRLTTDFGSIKNPRFSPNGKMLAFSSDREGSTEAYVVSLEGGNPRKLSFTGGVCLVVGWQSDAFIVVNSAHLTPFRQGMLYRVSHHGGDLQDIAVGPANDISYGPNEQSMVIQRHGYGYPSWKRYQGDLC